MNNEKIVFFDIDGTLLDHDKQIPASTRESLKKLTENGIHVAIATGRAPFMFANLREDLGINTFISFNGQYVKHEDNVVLTNPLSKEEITSLEEAAKENNHPMVFLDHEAMMSNHDQHPHIMKSMDDLKMHYPGYDPSYYHSREIYQALLFCESKEEANYRNTYGNLDFIRWHDFSMDVIPPGGSKARGIEAMIEHLGFKRENTYAFGDALNDIEMLKFAGTGIAMGNAYEEVKKVADVITDPVDQNGIRSGLEKVGLL
ncbi:Cof-type HAD-IIB family hydrolase [Guptibacillus hwajinpoensis]|uniref:Cof subfamily protein (Haloacid dehalogenase superfamily) n=1 Tax=Guptibacillus hwajinpoensis TaxID=208199 RepID=A0ABU0K1V1_9BACL|nr:Cof-type HAD-IIB family hydrolase [Alkalihalobacillus hemicentroti]MDQ0483337.1 Cof subfamily protein (haloacid dehalogenase superfamily) [Alkalihalobacillus hemicentroti]